MSKIVCFGEVLWDVFPDQKRMGGAPLNVAVRLAAFGNETSIISCVGNDADGKTLLDYIEKKDVDISHIQVTKDFDTSHVDIIINKDKSASYTIKYPCAWDFINLSESSKVLVKQSDVFIFGSLVARNQVSKTTLLELIDLAKFKVFDVNLRAPHYDLSLIKELMLKSDFIKFNDEELFKISDYFGFTSNSIEDATKWIANKTSTTMICVTRGADGALLFLDGNIYESLGYKVTVRDTVGAGDAFLATLIHHLQKEISPKQSINIACAVGALVASKAGANPVISESEIQSLYH